MTGAYEVIDFRDCLLTPFAQWLSRILTHYSSLFLSLLSSFPFFLVRHPRGWDQTKDSIGKWADTNTTHIHMFGHMDMCVWMWTCRNEHERCGLGMLCMCMGGFVSMRVSVHGRQGSVVCDCTSCSSIMAYLIILQRPFIYQCVYANRYTSRTVTRMHMCANANSRFNIHTCHRYWPTDYRVSPEGKRL